MLFNETDTEEVVEEVESEEEETETTEEEEKPKETLEAREARLARQLEQTRKKLGKDVEPPKKETSTSNEPDYAKLAYLKTNNVEHPDDQKLVMDEANRLKLPLTDVLQMEHIKSRLATNNDARVAQDGMPKGSGRKGGVGKSTVEYYLAHENEIPDDLDLHNKVIDAKMSKEKNSNMFSSTPFTG